MKGTSWRARLSALSGSVAAAVAVSALAPASDARAALALYEPFNYPVDDMVNGSLVPNTGLAGVDGQALTGTASPVGYTAPNGNAWFSSGYSAHSGSYSRANDALVNANDLSVTGLAHQASTNAANFGGAGSSPRIAFTSIDNDTVNGSSVPAYYSFAFRVTDLSATNAAGGLVGGFNNTRGSQSGNPSTVGAALYVKASGGGYVLGLLEQGTDATQATYDITELSLNTTYFVVGKYTINGTLNVGGATPTTDDTAEMWINPASVTFGGADPAGSLVAVNNRSDIPTNAGDGSRTVQSFFFRQGAGNSATNIIVDDLRIGTTYADVTPAVPEPTGLAALGLLGVGALSRVRRGGK